MVNSKLMASAVTKLSNRVSDAEEHAKRIQELWSNLSMNMRGDKHYYLVTPWFPTWQYHQEIQNLDLELYRDLSTHSRSKEQTLIVYSMKYARLSEDHRASLEKAPIKLHECTLEEFIAYIQAVKLNVDISKLWDQTNEDS